MDKVKFLNKNTGLRSHYWDSSKRDTFCRMWSTGGIKGKDKYTVSNKNTCKSICKMCKRIYKKSTDDIILTEDILEISKSYKGGWSKDQLNLIGVKWPPENGWKSSVLGKIYPKEIMATFVSLKNKHL
jgi:hypothetical protein